MVYPLTIELEAQDDLDEAYRRYEARQPFLLPAAGNEDGEVVGCSFAARLQLAEKLAAVAFRFLPEFGQFPFRHGLARSVIQLCRGFGKLALGQQFQRRSSAWRQTPPQRNSRWYALAWACRPAG
jgi:hypothetical protein